MSEEEPENKLLTFAKMVGICACDTCYDTNFVNNFSNKTNTKRLRFSNAGVLN